MYIVSKEIILMFFIIVHKILFIISLMKNYERFNQDINNKKYLILANYFEDNKKTK